MNKSVLILLVASVALIVGVKYIEESATNHQEPISIDCDNHYCEWDYDKYCWYLL